MYTLFCPKFHSKKQFYKPLSHVEILLQNDKKGADFDADVIPSKSNSGLPQVGIWASGYALDRAKWKTDADGDHPLAVAAAVEQRMQPAPSAVALQAQRPTTSCNSSCATAMCACVDMLDPLAGSSVAMEAAASGSALTVTPQKILAASGSVPRPAKQEAIIAKEQPMIGSIRIRELGSFVSRLDMGNGKVLNSEIFVSNSVKNMNFSASSMSDIWPEGSVISDAGGVMHPTLAMSLEQLVDDARNEHILSKNEEDDRIGL
jgi:hypothetical protein